MISKEELERHLNGTDHHDQLDTVEMLEVVEELLAARQAITSILAQDDPAYKGKVHSIARLHKLKYFDD